MEGCDPGCLSHHILPLLRHFGDSTDISTKRWKGARKERWFRIHVLAAFVCGILRTILAVFRISQYKFLVHINAYVQEDSGSLNPSVPVFTKLRWWYRFLIIMSSCPYASGVYHSLPSSKKKIIVKPNMTNETNIYVSPNRSIPSQKLMFCWKKKLTVIDSFCSSWVSVPAMHKMHKNFIFSPLLQMQMCLSSLKLCL